MEGKAISDIFKENLVAARDALDRLIGDGVQLATIEAGAKVLIDALRGGKHLISCGNGGSMSDAMHLAEELPGRFRDDRPIMAAVPISDPSYISCVANDYGYEQIFARFVQAVGRRASNRARCFVKPQLAGCQAIELVRVHAAGRPMSWNQRTAGE